MSFFGKVFSYVFNEALVNTLANSKAFQRFAVRSSKVMEAVQSKGSTHKDRISTQASDFTKELREQLKQGLDEQFGTKGSIKSRH